jgi:hypothetical protein
MKWCAVAAMLLLGCASSSSSNGHDAGVGGGSALCPTHPENCGGTCCGSTCVDTNNDPTNCGGCHIGCSDGEVCQGGHCGCAPSGIACGMGQSCCNAVGCKSLASDANNCGACGVSCGPGGLCTNGHCSCGNMTCSAAEVCCNGTCQSSCVNDMGQALDLSSSGALCQCSDHCQNDPSGTCVGPDCCGAAALLGACAFSSTCQVNLAP